MVDLTPVDFLSGLGQLPDPLRDMHEQVMRSLGQQRGQLENQGLAIDNTGKQQALDEQQQYISDLREHFGSNPTARGMAYMAARYPKAAQGIKAAAAIVDENRQQTDLTQLGSIWSVGQNALNEADPAKQEALWQQAAGIARRRLQADHEAGITDDDDARFVQMLESPDHQDRTLALGLIGQHLAAARPEGYAATLKATGAEARAQQQQPFDLRAREAEATTKEAEAAAAPGYYPARATNEQAQARTNEAEAATAPTYYGARARHEVASASIAETDSAMEAADKAATIGLKQGQIASLKSLVSLRAKQEGKLATEISVGEVMGPIWHKVQAGTPLTPGEAAAFAAYTNAPASQRLMNQPARGGRPAPAPAPASHAGGAPVRYFTNQQTGKKEAFHLVGGRWAKVQ